jgi:1-acyl-sn-glycerol-3-phosphate acyltransferase
VPNRAPGPFGSSAFARAWQALYEISYEGLESLAGLLLRPLFRVRRVLGPRRAPRGGVIYCPNHQSYLDPAFVQLVLDRRVTFVMTDDFYSSPAANWFFRLVGALPVGRGRLAASTVRRAAALLRKGAALVVFPEGKLSTTGELSRAQRGIAVLARRGRAPVVPVAIEGSMRAWPKGAKWFRLGDVRLGIGKPMAWSGPPEREAEQAFADAVLERVAGLRERMAERRALTRA